MWERKTPKFWVHWVLPMLRRVCLYQPRQQPFPADVVSPSVRGLARCYLRIVLDKYLLICWRNWGWGIIYFIQSYLQFKTQVSDSKSLSLHSLELSFKTKMCAKYWTRRVHLKVMESPEELFMKVLYREEASWFLYRTYEFISVFGFRIQQSRLSAPENQ